MSAALALFSTTVHQCCVLYMRKHTFWGSWMLLRVRSQHNLSCQAANYVGDAVMLELVFYVVWCNLLFFWLALANQCSSSQMTDVFQSFTISQMLQFILKQASVLMQSEVGERHGGLHGHGAINLTVCTANSLKLMLCRNLIKHLALH